MIPDTRALYYFILPWGIEIDLKFLVIVQIIYLICMQLKQ